MGFKGDPLKLAGARGTWRNGFGIWFGLGKVFERIANQAFFDISGLEGLYLCRDLIV